MSLLILCTSFLAIGQTKTKNGYRIEGDEVVFTFNKKDYSLLSSDKDHEWVTLDEVSISKVAVAGEFNDWSNNAWSMEKINDSMYQFRKKISDFKDKFDWQFKFVINDHYWAEPTEAKYVVPAKSRKGNDLYVYNLRMFTAIPSESGNATFNLKGFQDAENVVLSGSFNKWNEDVFKMKRNDEGWTITLKLRPDTYYYKFIVDGNWIEDPNNPDKVINEYGGFNSVVSIEGKITFYLAGYENAQDVVLSGGFNDWSEESYKMIKTDSGWTLTTSLAGGKHHYKFIVDGKWITDPTNPIKEYDGKGNINSVVMVKD